MFRLASGPRLLRQDTRRLGLAHALACVGFHGLRCRKSGWLAFRHGKDEYGIDSGARKVLSFGHRVFCHQAGELSEAREVGE